MSISDQMWPSTPAAIGEGLPVSRVEPVPMWSGDLVGWGAGVGAQTGGADAR